MPLALCREEPGTYKERLPRVESSSASTDLAERTQAVGLIREPRGRTIETSQGDDPREQTDEVSLHGEGRPGPVLRWNPKTRERSVDQLDWGLLPRVRATLPMRSARSWQGRKPWQRTRRSLLPFGTGAQSFRCQSTTSDVRSVAQGSSTRSHEGTVT